MLLWSEWIDKMFSGTKSFLGGAKIF